MSGDTGSKGFDDLTGEGNDTVCADELAEDDDVNTHEVCFF